MAETPDHHARLTRDTRELLELFERYGLSPDKHEDVWNLLVVLFMERRPQPTKNSAAANSFRKKKRSADRDGIVDDIIVWAGIKRARESGDTRGEKPIIHDIAEQNGWRADAAAVEMKWRRHQDLKKNSRRSRNTHAVLGDMLRAIFPTGLPKNLA
jgi:hypothetical protein